MYAVVLLNDDYTPMEFVVWILQAIFHKTTPEATDLMLKIHNHGRGVCGIYTHDVARSKAAQVETVAKRHEHPLACIIETCGTT
jgi:ATP-dependent Clp protease adaptor protein ClpS